MKAQEARDKKIFVLETDIKGTRSTHYIGNKPFTRFDEDYESLENRIEIIEENYYDWVMYSADETTTPRGVGLRLHIREADNDDGTVSYELWTWGTGGNNPAKIAEFETYEDAENELFRLIEEFDFNNDDQRDTRYYDTREEAEQEMFYMYCEWWGCSEETVKSIISKRDKLDVRRAEIEEIERQRLMEIEAKEDELAEKYAKLIEPVKDEPFKVTMGRLGKALPERLNKKLFIKAVKKVRSKV